jgi:3-methyladenine DNA glycosylase/8-oxoguanine DNA glycosylase
LDGALHATIRIENELEAVTAAQRPDGTIVVKAQTDGGVDRLRFLLGTDDDHSEFLRRFARDPLLAETIRRRRGLRPMRTGTVAQALLRAVAGQLIQARRAREIERAVIRAATPKLGSLHAPPTAADLGRFSPPQLARLGLHGRRAATLVRLCRALELERLKGQPTAVVERRLLRERGLGPWSVGVICLEGLGRFEVGLARDLGLTKLASALWGRWVEPEETDELLAPYGDWAGLASVYLLTAFAAGFVPLPDGSRKRLAA